MPIAIEPVPAYVHHSPNTQEMQALPFSPAESIISQLQLAQQPAIATGLIFESSSALNQAMLSRKRFIGDCPGFSRNWLSAGFRSDSIPPSPGLRVRLTNLSTSGEAPFTDRSYNNGMLSESTRVSLGGPHENQYFAVAPGPNIINYRIYNSSSTVEMGTFTLNITASESQEIRQAGITAERVCAAFASLSLDQCADIRIKQSAACPDGKVLSVTVQPDSQMVRTSILNQTSVQQSLIFNGSPIVLFPGQEFAFFLPKYSTQQVTCNGFNFNLTTGKKHRITAGYTGFVSIY